MIDLIKDLSTSNIIAIIYLFYNLRLKKPVRKKEKMEVLILSAFISLLLYVFLKPTAKWLGDKLLQFIKSRFS